MRSAFLVGRVIVGLYYLFSAFHHFSDLQSMSGYAASRGIPMPTLAVLLSGALLAIAGITLLLGWFPRIGIAAAVLFFLPVTFLMHAFWTEADPQARAGQMAHFLKNLALMGSTMMFAAIPEPWPYSVHARRRVHAPAHA